MEEMSRAPEHRSADGAEGRYVRLSLARDSRRLYHEGHGGPPMTQNTLAESKYFKTRRRENGRQETVVDAKCETCPTIRTLVLHKLLRDILKGKYSRHCDACARTYARTDR